MSFSLKFEGHSSLPVIPPAIPLQITICVPGEYVGQILPVIEPLHSPDQFPFLPLPCDFDYADGDCWVSLADEIQPWLLKHIKDKHTSTWLVGYELFWMVFVTAFPHFPCGTWPLWDLLIRMEGPFILCWISNVDIGVERGGSLVTIRQFIWDKFLQHAAV